MRRRGVVVIEEDGHAKVGLAILVAIATKLRLVSECSGEAQRYQRKEEMHRSEHRAVRFGVA